ncbi:hypothetical protein EI94DRAFT_1754905 [Lactarius quietus]|nr:hypothetical protein EI94DRAFT_1754905 [Lactarius quietus]
MRTSKGAPFLASLLNLKPKPSRLVYPPRRRVGSSSTVAQRSRSQTLASTPLLRARLAHRHCP